MARLIDRHSLICSDGVAWVEPEAPFKILIASFSNILRKIVRGQMVAAVLPQKTEVVPSTVTTADVLGFAHVYKTSKKSMGNGASKVSPLAETTPHLIVTPSVEDLDLSRLSPEWQAFVRKMVSRYGSM